MNIERTFAGGGAKEVERERAMGDENKQTVASRLSSVGGRPPPVESGAAMTVRRKKSFGTNWYFRNPAYAFYPTYGIMRTYKRYL
jgi:hypothetical protein